MADHDVLLELEHEGWRALSTADGAAYYAERLADDALMAFPFGLLDRRSTYVRRDDEWKLAFHQQSFAP